MSFWNTIYSHFDPVAFSIFGFALHWYGIAYLTALLAALFLAKYWIKRDKTRFPIDVKILENYFIWAEIGVVLGARIGFVLVYDPFAIDYFLRPWQIFNPFDAYGNFVGIRGMSYHGALVGFLLSSILFSFFKKVNLFILLDLIAISLPLAYIFGRIGNFLNQELFGRVIENPNYHFIGILVDGQLRYPSQLIEAFLEGFVVFLIVLWIRGKTTMQGSLIVTYGFAYSVARFVSEYFREPDIQMGVYIFGLSMGQILSFIMVVFTCIIYFFAYQNTKKIQKKKRK